MALGRAYAFFDCRASLSDIKAELPIIRKLAQTPSDLELHVIEGTENVEGSDGLREIAQQAAEAGNRYVIQACHPSTSNREVAREVADALNTAYTSDLYEAGEDFSGADVYETEDGDFEFVE
jgi:hypothetical protein